MPEHSQACFDVQTRRCVCPIEDAGARVRAAGPALLAMLLRLEWSGCYEGHLGSCVSCCPVCQAPLNAEPGEPGSTHAAGCELAALLEPLR